MNDAALSTIPNPNEDNAYGEVIHNEPSPDPSEDETFTIEYVMGIELNV